VLTAIARAAAELAGVPFAGFWLADHATRTLTIGALSDPVMGATMPVRTLPFDGTNNGEVVRRRAAVTLDDVLADPTFRAREWWVAHGIRSFFGLPVLHHETVVAVLALYGARPLRFNPDEQGVLDNFVAQAAVAIANARLYEETQTQRVRLAQIFDSTSDGIVVVSRAGEIQAANRQAGELLGVAAAEVIGLGLAELLGGYRIAVPDYDRVFEALRAVLQDPDRGGAGDFELRRAGRVVHWAGQPTKDAAGATVGLTLTLRDVTQERQVAQMKSDFVSFVTHQLRTPLAGIKWMLELGAETPDVPEETAGYIRDAREAAERLISLVNDLLDVSRLEGGKLAFSPQPTDLAALTRSVLDDLATLVRDKGHDLSVAAGTALPPVAADPQLLRQAILNLTSNAIKYTPRGGRVRLRLVREDGAGRWAVQDSGIGISPEGQRQLFEKFYRAENALTMETEGTGLGLYLVRLIVEKHGGQVWCESAEGQGSTFIFRVPVGD
jgi:PAS domain S-box-containing protein